MKSLKLRASPCAPTVRSILERYLLHVRATSIYSPEALAERHATLADFAAACGDMPVADCKPFHLADWIEDHGGWHSTSTRRAKATEINTAFNWAQRDGRIDRNPFAGGAVYEEAEPRPPMPDVDLAQLEGRTNERFQRALRFLRLTGCRLSEMCRLTWGDIDIERGLLLIHQHKSRRKTGRAKTIALVPEAVDLLWVIRWEQGHGYAGVVMLNNAGTPWNRRTLGQALARLKRRCGLKTKATLHGIRHQFGTVAVASGAPIKHVSMAMGHSSVAVTERYYLHLNREYEAFRAAAQAAQPKPPK